MNTVLPKLVHWTIQPAVLERLTGLSTTCVLLQSGNFQSVSDPDPGNKMVSTTGAS